MSLLLTAHQVEKTMGTEQLFHELSFSIHERQKIALLGPNGAGKSTLLKMLVGIETTDGGDISTKKNLKMAYVPQEDSFPQDSTIQEVTTQALIKDGLPADEAEIQATIHLSIVGFEEFDKKVKILSGGWRKRLSLAIAFAKEPELLLLDEPTNHMDWDGILWLEDQLKSFKKALLIVSHDREFLKNQCQEFMEINRLYKNGYFSLKCSYEEFLEKKQEYIQMQQNMQDSMANKARREVDWLRAGVKARTTKSSSRIKEAHQLLDNLEQVKKRNFSARSKVNIEIDSSGKKSKKFLEIKDLNIAYGDKKILENFDILLGPKMRIGLLGNNASGKTSLLRVISGLADNYSGSVYKAEGLKFVYFDQKREALDQNANLLKYLGDGSDFVQFKDRSIHVASYAAQFLFHSQKMQLPISRLSGGEQARLLIAKLLLQPADILVLDEPTNDLDIDTIEILEQSLTEFPGLVLVVSHDRYFLKSLCTKYLSLDGRGGWNIFADMHQWFVWQNQTTHSIGDKSDNPTLSAFPKSGSSLEEDNKTNHNKKLKISYKDKRQWETIEADIAQAENAVQEAQSALDANTDFSDHTQVEKLVKILSEKQKKLDELFVFWEKMEKLMNS
jgi:ABC transport system ATP-binding/permease protein